MEGGNTAWSDYESLRHNIKHNTVDRLKQILNGLNEECGTNFVKSGKKQDIIERIVTQLEFWRREKNEDKWMKAKAVLYQVRASGIYTSPRPTYNGIHINSTLSANPIAAHLSTSGLHTSAATVSGLNSYRRPGLPGSSSTIASTSAASKPIIKFKSSPFFDIDQAVSPVIECPESTNASNRQQQIVNFTLTNDHVAKLHQPNSPYQLRLFCTSSLFYSPNPNSFLSQLGPCLIEFPPTCEIRFNNNLLTANTKGLKKKPGTAPPANLGKSFRIGVPNRIDMVYVNSQQPAQPSQTQATRPKLFYLVVMLVQVTTVEQLVERLVKGKYRAIEEIRQKMKESAVDDDEIIAGPQKMSLKCPLSFVRISTPARSSQCVHSQCFDATSWFSIMEQTTTWLCPVCERTLNPDDLIIDGYFDDILKQCSEDVEDVMVEADGEWHTPDDKYASETWRAQHPLPVKRSPTPRAKSPPRTPTQVPSSDDQQGNAKAKNVEVLVLDSDDDEEEGRVKRELSYTSGSSSANQSFDTAKSSQSRLSAGVIDLTIDSDDERPSPAPPSTKRKASHEGMSPTEQIWKKGRTDHEPARTPPATRITLPPLSPYHSLPQRPAVTHPSMQPPHSHYLTNPYATSAAVQSSYSSRVPSKGNSIGNARSTSHSYNRNGNR